jgi:hypothetical protein
MFGLRAFLRAFGPLSVKHYHTGYSGSSTHHFPTPFISVIKTGNVHFVTIKETPNLIVNKSMAIKQIVVDEKIHNYLKKIDVNDVLVIRVVEPRP